MTRPEILDKAKECVCGQREQDYGSPENNFKVIADLWNAYMQANLFGPVDVAMMLGLLKVARIKSGTGTADSFVDLAGYAACGGEIATEETKYDSVRSIETPQIPGVDFPLNPYRPVRAPNIEVTCTPLSSSPTK